MTTIAELEVSIKAETAKLKSGLDSAKSQMHKFEGDSKSSFKNMEREWTNSIKNMVAAYIGLQAAWNLVREGITEGSEDVSNAIKANLKEPLAEVNSILKEIARSDIPARIAAALKVIGYNLAGLTHQLSTFYYLLKRDFEGAKAALDAGDESFRKANVSLDILLHGTTNINDQLKALEKTSVDTAKGLSALKTPTMMDIFEATTYEDTEGHRRRRTPGEVTAYASRQMMAPLALPSDRFRPHLDDTMQKLDKDIVEAITKPRTMDVQITIENINTFEDPLKTAEKIGAGIAMGANASAFKPRA